jgi:hypothetical protein
MRAIYVSIALLALSASAVQAQVSPTTRPRELSICWVNPGYESYRSRPWCEMPEFQPPGTPCSCPSLDGGRLPGRSRIRR